MAYTTPLSQKIKMELVKNGYFEYPQKTLLGEKEPLYIVPQTVYSLQNKKTHEFSLFGNGEIAGRGIYSAKELEISLAEIGGVENVLIYDAKNNNKCSLSAFFRLNSIIDDNEAKNQIYNTGELTYFQKENFKNFLNDAIGTDFEEESFDGGKYTLTVFDLTPKEVGKIREFENTKLDEPYEKFCAIWKLKDNDTIYRSEWLDSYDDADDLMAQVSTTFGVEKFKPFDFRMVETSIKSEQYKKENVDNAKEISEKDLDVLCLRVQDYDSLEHRILTFNQMFEISNNNVSLHEAAQNETLESFSNQCDESCGTLGDLTRGCVAVKINELN